MKIQKIFFSYLTIGAVVMSLLLGASAAQSQEVILDPVSTPKRATGITNLTVEGNVYNVTFHSYALALEMYGEVEGTFEFPNNANSAQNAVNAVNAALNTEGGVLYVGSEGGTNDEFAEVFYVGFRYQFVSIGELDGCNVQTGFTEDTTLSWIQVSEPDILSWYGDEKTYAEFTLVNGCIPATECTAGFECGTDDDGCGGTIDDCGTCGTGESCVDNICEMPGGDTDCDGIADSEDNCTDTYNSDQLDEDSDGIGDLCDETPGCGGSGEPVCEVDCTAAVQDLITHYYLNILGRAPDSEGLNYWTDEIMNLYCIQDTVNEGFITMAGDFFNSPEYLGFNTDNEQYVTDLYNTFYNREPDQGGLDYWLNELEQGMSRNRVLEFFVDTPEFIAYMDENLCTTDDCTPATGCSAVFNCGEEDDGCGGTIDCGTCSGEDTCEDNICTDGDVFEFCNRELCIDSGPLHDECVEFMLICLNDANTPVDVEQCVVAGLLKCEVIN